MYTIVVADDEEDLRKTIIRKIDWETIGFQVVGEAENGVEALELVAKTEPDLLLTDIRMPFISGLELAQQVREVRPSTQIVFLSGYDDFSYAQEAIRYNIISYLLKPISISELRENLIQIKERLDRIFAQFAERRRSGAGVSEFLLPLLLDGTQTDRSKEREERLLAEAVSCHFLGPENCNIRYVVLSVSLWDADGRNCTAGSYVHAVDGILQKYTKGVSFYLEDKITAVLAATPASLDKYLHIITDELVQSVERILKLCCRIGASEMTEQLSELNEAYRDSLSAMLYTGQDGVGNESYVNYIADLEMQRTKSSMDICERALHYIEENYADARLSLMTASHEIGVSPNYLSTLIKKKTGKSFVDYLTAKRMETAKRLLLGTSRKVREIAERCGYSDQHYFSYCFKKYAGASPNMLRQQAAGGTEN